MHVAPKVAARFWKFVPDQPGYDCWEWSGSRRQSGYGQLGVKHVPVGAHRIAYALCCGDPEGLIVCHACDNPPCVNPSHLFLGTQADNMRDAARKGRLNGKPNGRRERTHCPQGHPYTPENTVLSGPNVWRLCRTCREAPAVKARKLLNQRIRRRAAAALKRAQGERDARLV